MGHVVVKYKVTLDQPEDGSPDYEGIASVISDFEEVQEVEIKPLAFGMMYIEVQAVLGEGEGSLTDSKIGQAGPRSSRTNRGLGNGSPLISSGRVEIS